MSHVNIKDIKTYFINPGEIDKYLERKQHTEFILKDTLKISNVNHYKSAINKDDYFAELKKSTADILEQNLNDEPILIVEDDINVTSWYLYKDITVEIPDNADAVYLGIYRFAIDSQRDYWYLESIREPFSDNLVRVFNMLGAHAVIYKSKKYKQHIIDLFRDTSNTTKNDVLLARNLYLFNIYGYINPIFYQDMKFSNYSMQWCTYFSFNDLHP